MMVMFSSVAKTRTVVPSTWCRRRFFTNSIIHHQYYHRPLLPIAPTRQVVVEVVVQWRMIQQQLKWPNVGLNSPFHYSSTPSLYSSPVVPRTNPIKANTITTTTTTTTTPKKPLDSSSLPKDGSSSSNSSSSSTMSSLWYPVLGGLIITIGGGIRYAHDHFGGFQGMERALVFYSIAIPYYIKYRYHQYMAVPDDEWDKLHLQASQDALQVMLHLEGFFIKSGQMVSSNLGNAFPPIWRDTMSVLQDQVPPKEYTVIQQIVQDELGKPMDQVFSYFEPIPIGSASIGQVHRACLLDGTKVVVKVMYPQVEGLFRGDVRTIKLFAQVAQPVHVPALEEIEKQFMTEFDYQKEAHQLDQVRRNLLNAKLAGKSNDCPCDIPKPYLPLCTKRVLVMEELKGDKLEVGLRKNVTKLAARQGQSLDEFQIAHAQDELGKPRSAEEYKVLIALMNRQLQLENLGATLYNITVGWLPGFTYKHHTKKDELPINQAKLIDDLIYIHGYEVLVDGMFNGDPHPGNILLLGVDEGKPRLGLIDYGQVKRLSKATRLAFAKLIIALDDDNRTEIVRLMKELGYKSRDMNQDNIYLYTKVAYDQDNYDLTGGKHIQVFMEDLQARDPIESLPRELLMVSRASIMIRGLAHALNQSRSVAKAWRPIAEQVLHDEGEANEEAETQTTHS